MRDPPPGGGGHVSRFPVAFRPPAFASRSSDARRGIGPSSRSAYRTIGPDLDGVTAFRTHELRPGWLPPSPRGRRCSSRPEGVPGRRLPLPNGQSLHPRHQQSVGEARLTRHQRGFKQFSRPVFPSPGAPGQNGNPLSFPPSFAPRRPRAGQRTSRWGQAIEHGPGLHAQHHISRPSDRALTHYVRPRVAPPEAVTLAVLQLRDQCGRHRDGMSRASPVRWSSLSAVPPDVGEHAGSCSRREACT